MPLILKQFCVYFYFSIRFSYSFVFASFIRSVIVVFFFPISSPPPQPALNTTAAFVKSDFRMQQKQRLWKTRSVISTSISPPFHTGFHPYPPPQPPPSSTHFLLSLSLIHPFHTIYIPSYTFPLSLNHFVRRKFMCRECWISSTATLTRPFSWLQFSKLSVPEECTNHFCLLFF